MFPVAVPPRCVPKSAEIGGDRQQAEHVDRQDEKEGAPDVADETIGVGAQHRLRDLFSQVLADGLEEVGEAGRDEAADLVGAGAAPDEPRQREG